MQILLKGLPSPYEAEHLIRIFYPDAGLRQTANTRGQVAYVRLAPKRMVVGLRLPDGRVLLQSAPAPGQKQDAKLPLSRMLYALLCRATGVHPPWGMLTGVRPVRFLRRALQMGGESGAETELLQTYGVSPQKYALTRRIVRAQQPFVQAARGSHYSLYVSIPFCPTRCNYCSFVSRTMLRDAALVQPYMDKLVQELVHTAAIARSLKLQLQTIYVGGGTPTALSAAQLEQLLGCIGQHFPVQQAAEYTVEAGRPDCTTPEKLEVLKRFGVSRISINPQTMSDEVLAAIGRCHTAADVVTCFEQARRAGHNNINMDLIAGLPKDTSAGFADSLQQLLALQPENITLHTLTLKRASNLVIDKAAIDSDPAHMLEYAYPALQQAGYGTYYLYRQKSTVQNLENTGWCLPRHEGIYNIAIMEELHTILAAGAGATTKLVTGGGNSIQRIFNYKYPAEYLQNFEQGLAKMQGVNQFYARNLDT